MSSDRCGVPANAAVSVAVEPRVVALAEEVAAVPRGRRLERARRIRVVTEGVDERTRSAARAVRGSERAEERDGIVRRRGRVEDDDVRADAVQDVVATGEQRFVRAGGAAPVRLRVRLVPDDDGARVRHSRECVAGVRAEAALRGGRERRRVGESEHRKHDAGVRRRLLCACELVQPRSVRLEFAVPRDPDANGVSAEALLRSDDGERLRRPLERVVVDADEQPRRRGRVRREGQPRADADQDERGRGEPESQPSGRTRPRADCLITRHPVAATVRR